MAEPTYPIINDWITSWASISCAVGGENLPTSTALRAFRAISYKTTVERTGVRGEGRNILGFTEGAISHEASVTVIAEAYYSLIDDLGEGFMDKGLDLTVQFKLPNNRIRTVQIQAAGMKETGGDFSEGTDGLEFPIPLDVTRILYDNLEPTETTGGPNNF
jgi:hypothetical protein